jgi:hypothetical protein
MSRTAKAPHDRERQRKELNPEALGTDAVSRRRRGRRTGRPGGVEMLRARPGGQGFNRRGKRMLEAIGSSTHVAGTAMAVSDRDWWLVGHF